MNYVHPHGALVLGLNLNNFGSSGLNMLNCSNDDLKSLLYKAFSQN